MIFPEIFLQCMSHQVPSTFKLVYGHLNSIFLFGNFAWAFPIHFANSGPEDFAKFQIFDSCTVCGKTLRDSAGGYLLAYYSLITCFLGHTNHKQRKSGSMQEIAENLLLFCLEKTRFEQECYCCSKSFEPPAILLLSTTVDSQIPVSSASISFL